MQMNKKTLIKKGLTILSLLVLSSCSVLSPVEVEPIKKYTLNEIPHLIPSKKNHGGTLLVLEPDSSPLYRTRQMAYTTQPHQLSFFSYHEWGETPAQMLHPLIAKTLQGTHHFHTVVTQPYGAHFDYVLRTHILKLEQNFINAPGELELTLRAELSRRDSHQIIAVQEFSQKEPILQKSPYGGVIAANRATKTILEALAKFILDKIR